MQYLKKVESARAKSDVEAVIAQNNDISTVVESEIQEDEHGIQIEECCVEIVESENDEDIAIEDEFVEDEVEEETKDNFEI